MEDQNPSDHFSIPLQMLTTENIKVYKLKNTKSDKHWTEKFRTEASF